MQSPEKIVPKNKTAGANNGAIKIQISYRPTDELVLDSANPRQHSPKQIKQLAASLQEFGFVVPVVVDAAGRVVAGHARVLAAKKLGLAQVPVIEVRHLSPSQLKAFRLADNKLALNASWDDRLLAQELKGLSEIELDFPITLTGFAAPEIELIIRQQDGTPLAEQLDALATDHLVCRVGDIWLLGKHRIICADATSPTSFELLMEDKRAEMIFCDPPFNVKVAGNVSGKGKVKHSDFAQACGEMSVEEFTQFLATVFRNLAFFARDGSLHFIFMDWRHMGEMLAAGGAVYSELKNLVVWAKDNPGLGSLYRSAHELVFVFKQGTGPHINNIDLGRYGRNRSNVWHYESAATSSRKGNNVLELHPTVKPVTMAIDALLDCSNPGGIVLDAFLGSGTTLLAAERTGRICYGIELDPRYVDVAIRRWQNLTGKDAVLASSGKKFNEVERDNDR